MFGTNGLAAKATIQSTETADIYPSNSARDMETMKTLEAQIFAPSVAYHRPETQPYVISTSAAAIGTLFSSPTIKAIILRHIPQAAFLGSLTGKAVYTTNTMRDLSETIPNLLPPAGLDAIDKELAALPTSEYPSDDQ